jgi:hypothetical protein
MGATAAIISAVVAVASAGYGIYSSEEQASQQASQAKKMAPGAPPIDLTKLQKGMIPGAKADAAARAGGGLSPEFLAGIIGSESGGGVGLDVLGEIRSGLGQQGP